jgi:hypothetical protein
MTVAALTVTALSPLVVRAEGLPPGGSFVDDDTSPHQQAIEAITSAGITRGCNPPLNTRFCPEDLVTREQMAAFLVRALELPDAGSGGFTDIGNSIFRDDIDRIAAAGITVGCNPPDNDMYCPEFAVTRGQMAAFLVRAFHLPDSDADSFVDDDGSIFENAIERLRLAGITVGCNPPDNNRFCPDRSVTRAEMATFLARALDLDTIPVPARPYAIDVVSREEWGAAPWRGTFTTHEINQITIHHAGDLVGVTGPAQFRGWQDWHFHLGWPDIAYHFIVGQDGRVYEGRPYTAVGDTATSYDPTGHLLLVVEGNFDEDTPSDEQLEMLAQMIAWGSIQFDVPVDAITGHRDHAATTCPGDALYAKIQDGTLSSRAEQIIAAGGVTIAVGG